MNPFKGIKDAKPSVGGNYIKLGKHTFEIGDLKVVESSKKRNQMFYIAELKTVASTAHNEGESVSFVVDMEYLSDIKHFIAAAVGCEFDDVDDDLAASSVHKKQPFEGVLVDCEAYNKKTKNGGDFTKCKWSSVSEEAAA